MRRTRDHLSFANVMSVAAVFIALGGSAIAINKIKANSVGSKQLKTGAVRTDDLADNSVTSPKVANGSLLDEDFKAGQLPAGAQGPPGAQGLQGSAGAQGAQGIQGPPGSPDTGAQILAKLAPVDGGGSGLDADTLDGQNNFDIVAGLAPKVADTVHVVNSGGGEPAFQGGFTSASAAHGVPGFFRDGFGVIHLQGTFKLPGPGGGTVFTLPAGYRPGAVRIFVSWHFGNGSVPKPPVGVAVDATTGDVILINDLAAGLAMDDEVNLDEITFRCSPSGSNGCP
jgi:hypothetical protein